MKNRILIVLSTLALLLAVSACKNESNTNNTSSSTTSTSATDTSMTTSTTNTTGTPATSSTTGTSPNKVSEDDSKFMIKAAEGNIAEVSLGSLAAQQGTNADVKSFGNRMVTDHGKANDELKQLATNKGVTLPTETNQKMKDTIAKLSKETGKKFDKDFMDGMVKGHEEAVADFEKESKDAKDADLKAWVSNTLPTFKDHLKMAKEIQGKVK